MDEKTEKFYNDLFALTGTPEWKTLVEDYAERMEQIEKRAIDAADLETLYFLKGQHSILRDIVNKRTVLDMQFKSINEEDQA